MLKFNKKLNIIAVTKKVLLPAMAMALFAACSDSQGLDAPQGGEGDGRVNLSLSFQLPAATRAGLDETLPAEQINSFRIVIVDTGIDTDGNYVADPSVEYNHVMSLQQMMEESGYVEGERIVELNILKVYADRKKKAYIFVNAEPEFQSYLNIRTEDGKEVKQLDEDWVYKPNAEGVSPIDNAVFTAPIGSYVNNNITTDKEVMLQPLTAKHEFTIPTINEVEEEFKTFNGMLTYKLPSELLIVKAVNKVWFNFINDTFQPDDDLVGLDLLITGWSLSDVNHGDSYLFGNPGENNNVLTKYPYEPDKNVNPVWMQWIFDEATHSQTSSSYTPQWLTDYNLPEGATKETLNFYPYGYSGTESAAPTDEQGLYLESPKDREDVVKISTEALPVYFSESHSGNPQKYEMTFTVWSRVPGQEWSNPVTYSVVSSTNASDDAKFKLLSLFRSTDVVMDVTFKRVSTGLEMVAELHPYGSVTLNPGFGL